mmetsp:Transcript_41297/g.117855  ORF Transcript_41297/g.117855 Transcript_41297/m.117855 type:complete len:346 (+) Transcript_41297:1293-2330(+)
MPIHAPQLRPQQLVVLIHGREPWVLEIRTKVSKLLLVVLLLNVELAVVHLMVGLLLLLVIPRGALFGGGLVALQAGYLRGQWHTTGFLGHHRRQTRRILVTLEPGPHDLVPEFIVDLRRVVGHRLGLLLIKVVNEAGIEALELLLAHDFLDLRSRDSVPVHVLHYLSKLLTEPVAPVHEALARIEVLIRGLRLRDEFLEVPRLHCLALGPRADARESPTEFVDALQELIQRVVRVADNEHGRVPDRPSVLEQCLHDLQPDPGLSRAGRSLDQGHLVCQRVLDGVQLRRVDVEGLAQRIRPFLQDLERLGCADGRVRFLARGKDVVKVEHVALALQEGRRQRFRLR